MTDIFDVKNKVDSLSGKKVREAAHKLFAHALGSPLNCRIGDVASYHEAVRGIDNYNIAQAHKHCIGAMQKSAAHARTQLKYLVDDVYYIKTDNRTASWKEKDSALSEIYHII